MPPEQRFRERNDWVNLLLDSTAEAIYGLDLEGRCIFCNASFLRMLGYEEEGQLLGQVVHAMIHHTRPDGTPYPPEECLVHRALQKNICIHVEEEVLWRADGTSFPVEYWSHPIRRGDEVIGVVVTFLDITDRKRAEAESTMAFRELDGFVGTVSHDLRSPLTAIIGFADLLKRNHASELSETGRSILDTILAEGERMAAMLADLLSLAQVGKLPRPSEPVQTCEVVQEVIAEIAGQSPCPEIRCLERALPPVYMPRTLLIQIFANLIGNAVRYAGPQGGPIEIGGKRVRNHVHFCVRDHGPGIPEDERERIFEAFYRGSTGKKTGGTGIGLAIVQKIARHNGGRAWIEETPGGGATFWVEFAV